MSAILRGSSKCIAATRLPAALLVTSLISVAGAGCIDGTAVRQAASEASLQAGDLVQPDPPLSLRETWRQLRTRAIAVGWSKRFFIDDLGSFITGGSAANSRLVSAAFDFAVSDTGPLRARDCDRQMGAVPVTGRHRPGALPRDGGSAGTTRRACSERTVIERDRIHLLVEAAIRAVVEERFHE